MFRVVPTQGVEDAPGWCRLQLIGLNERSDRIELMISKSSTTRPYLGRSDWENSETWLEFRAEAAEGDTLVARLGPPYTLRLATAGNVEIRARVPGGVEARTRLAWPRIVLPAVNDATLDPPAESTPPAAEFEQAAAASPPIELRASGDERSSVTGGPRRHLLVAAMALAALLVIGVAGGAAWYLMMRDPPKGVEAAPPAPQEEPAPAEAAAGRRFTEEAVRSFLATNPEGPATTAEAIAYEEAGRLDLALLLYRYAARRGEPKASAAIGRMYDPDGFDPKKSAFAVPDADQAASYYTPAAEAGDAETQYRLGRLLLSGRTAGDDDAERGVAWLRRASDQGHADARAELQRLQQQVE